MSYDTAPGISIHAAREGGDPAQRQQKHRAGISIHAAREGGDTIIAGVLSRIRAFQSTPPVKAATKTPAASAKAPEISIHAAREGGDEDT